MKKICDTPSQNDDTHELRQILSSLDNYTITMEL